VNASTPVQAFQTTASELRLATTTSKLDGTDAPAKGKTVDVVKHDENATTSYANAKAGKQRLSRTLHMDQVPHRK